MLNTGNVLFWYKTGNASPNNHNNSFVLSGTSGDLSKCVAPGPNGGCVLTDVEPNPPLTYDILCAGMSAGIGPDQFSTVGAIIATGGMTEGTPVQGIPNTTFFTPSGVGGTWTPGTSTPMNYARFYPSNVQQFDGTTLVLGGSGDGNNAGHLVRQIEAWAGGPTAVWQTLQGIQVPSPGTTLYPRLKLVPDTYPGDTPGEYVMAGESALTNILDPPLTTWSSAGSQVNPGNDRSQGGVVILPIDSTLSTPNTKILTAGGDTGTDGTGCPTNTAEIFTAGSTNSWAAPAGNQCMCYARYNHNLVLLADGTVLAVQGGNGETGMADDYAGPIATPELYTPSTGAWRVLKAYVDSNGNPVNRTYHSTALLLPDGRVLSAGSDTFSHPPLPGTYDNTFQIFSPPYMFATTRPVISSVSPSSTVSYGSNITISTPDTGTAASIATVALVRPGTTTHANDFEQRYVTLGFHVNQLNQTQLIATLPPSNVAGKSTAPPGYYMLFIVNNAGVPSVSYISSGGIFLQIQ